MQRSAYPQIPLDGLPRWAAVRDPDGAAITTDSGTCTFAELDQQADRVAHCIRRTAGGAGAVVGVAGALVPAFAAAYYGASRSGHTFALVDPRLGEAALQQIFTAAEIEIAFVPAATAALLTALRGRLPRLHTVVVIDADRRAVPAGTITLPSALEGVADDPVVVGSDLDAVTCVRFRTGRAGRPEGVRLTHRGLVARARKAALVHRLGPESVTLNHFPVYRDLHLNSAVYAGASQVLCPEPGPVVSLPSRADGELFVKPSRAT